ncbi:OpgC family protein [Beijerinckia indica]|uniref:OpgC protein n=1 Tax=Beijerinckia indica subsp. indica (strain ATCC 9039 / DSM 1715 / NCIMB 8712) TaxID=395963 RepID=B2IGP9_BEII9|nr:OpgC domain-containing protein [Beijerinckia indica]ACB95810.1 OpgC protein [Beijerinckia indica subsp. indica ATCC 9039]
MRAANEIDFWRGFALVTIFINHIPGLTFERFTFRNISLSDSAELFVFLAGWAMRLLVQGSAGSLSPFLLVMRLGSRGLSIYAAQTVLTELAIAMLAGCSILLDAPFLLDWHNASAVFLDPIRAHVGLVLLTYQLGYFNILPLYVVLTFLAPGIVLLHRIQPRLVLPLSVSIYLVVLIWGLNVPTWPDEGTWFFNPFAWQLLYVLGFLLAGQDGVGAWARRHRRLLRLLAVPIVLIGIPVALIDYAPDPIAVPEPKLFFMFDKTFLSPVPLLHSLALVALVGGLFPMIFGALPGLCRFLALLGRNSLNVFCMGSLLSLGGQIFRFVFGGRVATDAILVIFGIAIMGLVAWASEWRNRLQARSSGVSDGSADQPRSISALPG